MKIITLCREYGAGGHSIGCKVAKSLGIEIYDKDIIRKTALALGIPADELAKNEEIITRSESFFRNITPISYDQKTEIYDIQRKIILELAQKGPCVILGRCAGTILSESGIDSLNVFLYADDIHRAFRIGELNGLTQAGEIQHLMKKVDHERHNYYTRYTGKTWGDRHNFDLMLDTGSLGYDLCSELICAAALQEQPHF